MESMIKNTNSVKVSFDNELRRFNFEGFSFQQLHSVVTELYGLAKDVELVFRYVDNEGDKITLSSDVELKEGLQISQGVLRLYVTRKVQNKVGDGQKVQESKVQPPEVQLAPEKPLDREQWRQLKAEKKLAWQQELKEGGLAQCRGNWGRGMGHKWGRQHWRGFGHHLEHGFGPAPEGMPCEKGPKLIARHVKDVTAEDGTEIPAGTAFVKTWRIRNEGPAWPAGCRLLFVSRNGDNMNGPESVPVPYEGPVQPNAEVDISVPLVAPTQPGRYVGFWRLCTPEGRKFGQRVWVSIIVPGSSSDESSGVPSHLAPAFAKYGELADSIIQKGFDVKKHRVAKMLARCDGDVDRVVQILTKRGRAIKQPSGATQEEAPKA